MTLVPMELYDVDGWFDGAIQESLACGTPVAALKEAANTPSRGSFGFLLSRNIRNATKELSAYLDEPELLEELGEMGAQFVHSHCTHDHLSGTLRQSWEEVMHQ